MENTVKVFNALTGECTSKENFSRSETAYERYRYYIAITKKFIQEGESYLIVRYSGGHWIDAEEITK